MDETADVAQWEQMSICWKYVDQDLNSIEGFVGFFPFWVTHRLAYALLPHLLDNASQQCEVCSWELQVFGELLERFCRGFKRRHWPQERWFPEAAEEVLFLFYIAAPVVEVKAVIQSAKFSLPEVKNNILH